MVIQYDTPVSSATVTRFDGLWKALQDGVSRVSGSFLIKPTGCDHPAMWWRVHLAVGCGPGTCTGLLFVATGRHRDEVCTRLPLLRLLKAAESFHISSGRPTVASYGL